MKKYIIALLALLPLAALAQDSAMYIRYLHIHNWTKKMAAVDYISKQQKEKQAYIWGNRSEWKTYTNFYFKDGQTFYADSEEKAEEDENQYSWKRDAYYVRRDYKQGTMSEAYTLEGRVYMIEDSIQAPNWKILNDMKEVNGHVCMNATYYDTLKMQSIVAWFALDMPIDGGPEYFSGLPGLILEVDINNGGLTIIANKIEKRNVDKEMTLPKKKQKGKKMNQKEYTDVLTKHMADRRKNEQPPFWGMRY